MQLLSVAFGLGLLNKQSMRSGVSAKIEIEWQTPVLGRGGGVVGGVFALEQYKFQSL